MRNKNQSYKLGTIEIQGPTSSEKRCSIFIDLAEILNTEDTSDAVEKLKSEWKLSGRKGKLDFNAESDYVTILTSKSAIVELVALISQLSINTHPLGDSTITEAKKNIKQWKQPEPFSWNIGDIFAVQLTDGNFTYGQVLDKTYYNAPTCLLFSKKSEKIVNDIKLVIKATPISILHVHGDHLNDESWKVIGNTKPILGPGSGPCGVRGSVGSKDWDGFEALANAWHGLRPWNIYYKENYLDGFLLKGITRPENIILLNREELETQGVKRPEWS